MKKHILILTLMFIFVASVSAVAWSAEFYGGGGYYGKTSFTYKENRTKLQINLYDSEEYLKSQNITPNFSDVESSDIITSQANESDNGIFAFTLSDQNNKENPYPQITSLRIYLQREQSSGLQYPIGENYRLYRLEEDNTFIKIDITESTKHHIDFNIDKFGTYVLYFEPARYDVIFYTDAEIYDDVDDDAPCDEVYYEDKGLLLSDIISYPEELPQKEGYVFAGWINWNFMGPPWKFCGPLPLTTTTSGIWLNALWYPEDEYEPLQLTLSSEETIIKGKEDGCVLTLTTSDGYFSDSYCDEEGNVPPEYFLSTETVGKEDAEIYYNLVGSDELLFESVKRIDEQTLELTLDGNSTNTKKNTDIKVEIDHSMLYSSVTQIDEYGFMRDKLVSDNAITLKKQSAEINSQKISPVDSTGKSQELLTEVKIADCTAIDGTELAINAENCINSDPELKENVLSNAKSNEYLFVFELSSEDTENPYPEINDTRVTLEPKFKTGHNYLIGKDHRLYLIEDNNFVEVPITKTPVNEVWFTAEKLGKYVLYFDPAVYSAEFYSDIPEYDDDGNLINSVELYSKIENLKAEDIIKMPEIPQKEGYVFTGWKTIKGSGIYFTPAQPFTVMDCWEFYATWCPEDEYEPLELTLSSRTIPKGKENGRVITLKASQGYFIEEEELQGSFRIVGNDEISIGSVKRVDDQTLELTLSGNSADIESSTNIWIEFECGYLKSDIVQLDSDGVRKQMYVSDNAITLKSQTYNRGDILVPFDTMGEFKKSIIVELQVDNIILADDTYAELSYQDTGNITLTEDVFLKENAEDYIFAFNLSVDNKENPYPEIKEMYVQLRTLPRGEIQRGIMGKDYRLYRFENNTFYEVPINNSNIYNVSFTADKLGTYILYYDPAVYEVTFYDDNPYLDDEEFPSSNEICKLENLAPKAKITFPEIPQKKGYIFTGWKEYPHVMGGGVNQLIFVEPNPTIGSYNRQIFASWCKEEEYEPLEISVSAPTITKGKEDGKVITLTVSNGTFEDEENMITEWRSDYENTDDEGKITILNEWKLYWNIVGNDEILIESVKRIDDQTLELVLSGNSTDTKSSSDIKVEFKHSLLDSDIVQLDSDGVVKSMFISDNAITLKKQSRPVSDGGGASPTVYYSVNFNSNGGSEVETQKIVAYTYAKEPQDPTKDGYTFDGWYSDEALTMPYRFDSIVKGNITLYAAWKENEKDIKDDNITEENNTFILTVGKNTATVWGEEKTSDVAPVIRNDRAMLPARFVAENLGASVEWNANGTVTVTKDDTIIIITIGSDKATVNGEEKTLDSPAFIENDRTYTPIRFISENLGAKVDWNEENQEIIITKN